MRSVEDGLIRGQAGLDTSTWVGISGFLNWLIKGILFELLLLIVISICLNLTEVEMLVAVNCYEVARASTQYFEPSRGASFVIYDLTGQVLIIC